MSSVAAAHLSAEAVIFILEGLPINARAAVVDAPRLARPQQQASLPVPFEGWFQGVLDYCAERGTDWDH